MYLLFVILMVIAALLMCFIVLIQNSKGGGLASGFSSSNAIMGVRKTTDFLEKATWGLAIFMVVMSIATAYVVPRSAVAKDAVLEQAQKEQQTVEDQSGNLVQKEYAGTESKSETEKLLRQAMDDYDNKKFVAKTDNLTVGDLLNLWSEEELKTGTLSNGTVENYLGAIRVIKKHPIADRKLKNVTAEHLQSFFDLLTFGGEYPDGTVKKGYSKDYIHSFSAVLQQAFRFAVFPKQFITFNPMQYIKLKKQAEDVDLFSDDDIEEGVQPISHEDYQRLIKYLEEKNPPAILPIQIAYYAGLRIGEVCGLTWQDINLEEQYQIGRASCRERV